MNGQAVSHQLSEASCHEHKNAGKGAQKGRNSVLTMDGQTETQVHLLSCAFAAKNTVQMFNQKFITGTGDK